MITLALVAVGVAAIFAYLRFFEWKNLYYPARQIVITPASAGLQFDDVWFMTEDNERLHGWWIPHPHARGTVVHCHGNAGNIGDRAWIAADLHRLGVNVFLYDYRGYGNSEGIPTEEGTYRDARAAFEVVRAKHGDSEKPPVVVYGQSLGAAVAVQLALDKPVRGLILESGFFSTADMARRLYPGLPLARFLSYRYNSGAKVGKLTMPKLFAHSPVDDLIPFEQAERLYAAAAEPKTMVSLVGGHNDAGWSTSGEYWKAVEALLDACFGAPRPGKQ